MKLRVRSVARMTERIREKQRIYTYKMKEHDDEIAKNIKN